MNTILDPGQGDNASVYKNSNIYRGEEIILERAVYLPPGCQTFLSDKQEAWVENGGTV